MKANLRMALYKVMEYILGLMDSNIKDNGKIIKSIYFNQMNG